MSNAGVVIELYGGNDFTGTPSFSICKSLNTNYLLEARVGIEPNVPFTLIFPSPRQNASCRTYAANPCKIAGFDTFVKLLTTPSKLQNNSHTTLLLLRCWQFCWHFACRNFWTV